jgi:polyhydroxyalkanoate synthesis regulator phasin
MPPAKRSSSSRSQPSSSSKPAGSRSRGGSPSTRSAAATGAKATGTSAGKAAGRAATQAKSGATKTRNTAKSEAAKELARRTAKSRDVVMLTRDRIQETLDDAASRGRVTRKDANELAAELIRRGRQQSDELISDLEALLERGRDQLESATRRARKVDSVDRLVRGADRARRAAGVGPSFPILGYDELNVSQVQTRIKELSRPDLRKVLNYERKHANRKTVVGAIEKSLG